MNRYYQLADMVAPQSVEDFININYGRQWFYRQCGEDNFSGLADWDVVNTILATQRFEAPRFRVARRGEILPVERYTKLIERIASPPYRRILSGPLLEELRNGATLTIDRVDHIHEPLRYLTAKLEAELRAKAFAIIFASWDPVPGFDRHWDDQDFFVVQLSGHKHWQIFEPTREWPLLRDIVETPEPKGPPVAEFDMAPGDVLYLPHGWWHAVSSVGEPSLHVTVCVVPDNGIDFMSWLVDRTRQHELFRRRVPRFDTDQRKSYLADLRAYWTDMLKTDDVLDQFCALADGTSDSLPTFSLPDILSENTVLNNRNARIELVAPRASVVALDSGFVLTGLARRWKFPSSAKPLVDAILSSGELTVEQAIKAGVQVTEEECSQVIFTLLRAGVITLR